MSAERSSDNLQVNPCDKRIEKLFFPTTEYLKNENNINSFDHQYAQLQRHVLVNGIDKKDRTGTGTRSVFGYQMRFDLSDNKFPLLTTKKLHTKSIIHELLWFLKGDTNVKYLKDNNVSIWNEWADKNGHLGPVYGSQWRNWQSHNGRKIDQISEVVGQIKNNPDSRRMVVTAWNPSEVDNMALPPCHMFYQFYVADGKLSCQMYQRSADLFLGVPFNIASYALLTHMVAQTSNLKPGEFIHTFGDVHIYNNHIVQTLEQLSRVPYSPPNIDLNKDVNNIFDFNYEDINIVNYKSHPAIKADISI